MDGDRTSARDAPRRRCRPGFNVRFWANDPATNLPSAPARGRRAAEPSRTLAPRHIAWQTCGSHARPHRSRSAPGRWWVSVQARLDYGSPAETRQWFWHRRASAGVRGRPGAESGRAPADELSRRGRAADACRAGSAAARTKMFRLPWHRLPRRPASRLRRLRRPRPRHPRCRVPREGRRGRTLGPCGDADPPRAHAASGRVSGRQARCAGSGAKVSIAQSRGRGRSQIEGGCSKRTRHNLVVGRRWRQLDRLGVELVQRGEHDVGQRERLRRPAGRRRFGIAITRIPAAAAERMPFVRVLDRGAARRGYDLEPAAASR